MKEFISSGKAILGIELGSTRIKTVLIGADNKPIAIGGYDWENKLEDGIWTYDLEDAWFGIRQSYKSMADDVKNKYGVIITKLAGIGISAMMHGYLVFNNKDELLAPFRTWRNTMTEVASNELGRLLNFNMPQRWSTTHLYQCILDGHTYIDDIVFQTTLAGYMHWKLTGEKVIGIGDAAGMFPIDSIIKNYDKTMIDKFNKQIALKGYHIKVDEIMPKILVAGENAGTLNKAGAKMLDESGNLQAGIPMCPPEGDGGTGMVATNSVAVRTGNVSAGTSVFAMIVLEKALSKPYESVDMVTTPSGEAVAMVHCNNCTSDLNAWVNIFNEFAISMGMDIDKNKLFETLYNKALEGDEDCGGLLAYNYFSGEHITGFEEGRPLFVRKQNSKFTLANFIRVHLYTSLGALKTGMDLIKKAENVKLDVLLGHGGLFKTPVVGQKIMASAINTPVKVMETAGEGGAWGIAILASYMVNKQDGQTLVSYLEHDVFKDEKGSVVNPEQKDVEGFNEFLKLYTAGFAIERAAVDNI
ncbi:MAG: ATPase [Epulopiscium sp. Nuni2H_MBin003]|nr:MAG: ATPase [Epulopiscium sp. Nuni2H_MBin003]